MENRQTQIQQLNDLFSNHQTEPVLPDNELKLTYDLFKGSVVPEIFEVFSLVERKGKELPRFYSWRTQLTPDLVVRFERPKNPTENYRISISDGAFIDVLFQFGDDKITIEDTNIEKQIVLEGPQSLIQPIPSSKKSTSGNALAWIEKITAKITDIKEELQSPNN